MKKILFIVFALIALQGKSQVIDTTFRSITSCKIEPFKAKFSDTINVDHLGVRIANDDLKTTALLYWALMDSLGIIHVEGSATITGIDYANWNGNNIYPFQFVGKKLNIVFIKPEEN